MVLGSAPAPAHRELSTSPRPHGAPSCLSRAPGCSRRALRFRAGVPRSCSCAVNPWPAARCACVCGSWWGWTPGSGQVKQARTQDIPPGHLRLGHEATVERPTRCFPRGKQPPGAAGFRFWNSAWKPSPPSPGRCDPPVCTAPQRPAHGGHQHPRQSTSRVTVGQRLSMSRAAYHSAGTTLPERCACRKGLSQTHISSRRRFKAAPGPLVPAGQTSAPSAWPAIPVSALTSHHCSKGRLGAGVLHCLHAP